MEISITRTNVTPRQFYTYCKAQMKKKNNDIEGWIAGYNEWAEPYENYEETTVHDWGEQIVETNISKPYEHQEYVQKAYNFIMEFYFYGGEHDGNKGTGYLYCKEWE